MQSAEMSNSSNQNTTAAAMMKSNKSSKSDVMKPNDIMKKSQKDSEGNNMMGDTMESNKMMENTMDDSASYRNQTASERSAHCYRSMQGKKAPCEKTFVWQTGKYIRDECGSGVVPTKFNFKNNRKYWCHTPLSMYQATHGDLGRKILCRTAKVVRDIRPAPPCNIEEFILPPCRGYYRKYECIRPCEERFAYDLQNKRIYRDSAERYWQPCMDAAEERRQDIRNIAPHNITLAKRLRRAYGTVELPCW